MKNFYFKNKKFLLVLLLIVGSFSVANICSATIVANAVNGTVGFLAGLIVQVTGFIMSKTIDAIISIASYNNFIKNSQIIDAWKIIRDICNMFFILILLIIAFATILRVESYNMKTWLPKLVLMSILINFSRTICGILIDASQIFMATFVNAFRDGGGNFVSLLQINKFLEVVKNSTTWLGENDALSLDTIVVSYLLAVIVMLIATIAMLAVLVVFVMRMIMLWIYVVLSPLAFLLASFPGGQKYAGQYWGDFTKYLLNGPVLAFFIWLALYTLGNLDTANFVSNFEKSNVEGFTAANYMNFILAIGFLVGGLMMSQQIGGMGAGWGMEKVGQLKNKGLGFAKQAAFVGTGARWATERWDAFQGKRAAERKEKVGRAAETMFATYKGVVERPKAEITAAASRAGAFIGITPAYRAAVQKWEDRKQSKQTRRNNLFKAASLEVGKEIEEGGIKYKKTADGVKVTEKGEEKEYGQGYIDWRSRAARAYSPARQLKQNVEKADFEREKTNLSRLTLPEQKRVALDSSASRISRAAASANVIDKEKVTEEEFNTLKKSIKGVSSVFEETKKELDKKYAVWNNTPEEFEKKFKEGKIDVGSQSTSQLTAESLERIAKLSGPKYADNLKTMNKTTNDDANITKALKEVIEKAGFDETGLEHRKAYVKQTGDVGKAFFDQSTKDINQKALSDFVSKAKPAAITDMDEKLFNRAGYAKAMGDDKTFDNFTKAVQDGIKVSQIDAARKTGNASPELIKALTELAQKAGKEEEIKNYKELSEVVGLKPNTGGGGGGKQKAGFI